MSQTASGVKPGKFRFDDVDQAIAALCQHVKPVDTQSLHCPDAAGLILAQPITLDRPSPPCSVSAMDGYALRLADARPGDLPIAGQIQPGQPASDLPVGAAVRIFTGGMVPPQAELVIQREHLQEHAGHITLPAGLSIKPGQHIRLQGENGPPGQVLCEAGRPITAPVLAAMASVGMTQVTTYRPLRIGILVTGGEVLEPGATPAPWQIRDSNGPALAGLLSQRSWLAPMTPQRVHDDPALIESTIEQLMATCDALLLTGGVSAGDYDFVPDVLAKLGARTVFHSLPLKPGKPVLGAVTGDGRPILGLPGNPVSALVTARRIALPALRKRAGYHRVQDPHLWVTASGTQCAPPSLTLFAQVQLTTQGQAQPVQSKGSGDWVSAVHSDGFVEVPPGQPIEGTRRFYPWSET